MINQRMTQRAPPSNGRKNRRPRGAVRACLFIVKRFPQPAAALREKQAGAVQRIGRLVERCYRLLEALFAHQDGSTGWTLREMRIESRARARVQFVASGENGERLDVLAANAAVGFNNALRRIVLRIVHSSPSNCARSLRVARKSEFFTVSSVVPRASTLRRRLRALEIRRPISSPLMRRSGSDCAP